MSSPTTPEIHASLRPTTIARGGTTTVVLTLTHRGTGSLFVAHPTVSTGALTAHVKLPSGEERVLKSAPSYPGVPPRQANAQLQPNQAQTFEIDVGAQLPLDLPGRYVVRLEYAVTPGQPWRSPELEFSVR